MSKLLKYNLFLDDITLYCFGKSLEWLLNIVELEFQEIVYNLNDSKQSI